MIVAGEGDGCSVGARTRTWWDGRGGGLRRPAGRWKGRRGRAHRGLGTRWLGVLGSTTTGRPFLDRTGTPRTSAMHAVPRDGEFLRYRRDMARARKRHIQQTLRYRDKNGQHRGGKRPGAGRPAKGRSLERAARRAPGREEARAGARGPARGEGGRSAAQARDLQGAAKGNADDVSRATTSGSCTSASRARTFTWSSRPTTARRSRTA